MSAWWSDNDLSLGMLGVASGPSCRSTQCHIPTCEMHVACLPDILLKLSTSVVVTPGCLDYQPG